MIAFTGDLAVQSLDDLRCAVEGNYLAAVELTRAVLPAMRARKFGRVVNITSAMVTTPRPAMVVSAGARAALTVTRHVDDLVDAGIVIGDARAIGRALWAAAHGVIVLYLAGRLPKGIDVSDLYFETMRLAFRGARTPSRKIQSIANRRHP